MFVAGTALPDWMSVLDRKNRARRRYAEEALERQLQESDHPTSERQAKYSFIRGVIQHHTDDHWFHSQQLFQELCTQLAVEVRNIFAASAVNDESQSREQIDRGHQAGFLGHIAIELLLDAYLIEQDPSLLTTYYDCLQTLNPSAVEAAANQVLRKPVDRIKGLIPRFVSERFLDDYVTDSGLRFRLNGVMKRVGLPALPESIDEWLGETRVIIYDQAKALLPKR